MQILFLIPYPLQESPSQRFRFEQYFQLLEQNGHHYHVHSFLSSHNWRSFYSSGKILIKITAIFGGIVQRVRVFSEMADYDFVFIHREATPIGPPIFEWILAKILRKKIIYDFDDAIWITDNIHESVIAKKIRWRSKVRSICSWSYKVSCGNEYLCAFARQYNSNVIYNPTTIDTENLHNPGKIVTTDKKNITIGWTGSHSTLKYLKIIELELAKLEQEYPHVEILIIANQKPNLQLRSFKFLYWQLETELADLEKIDIGIMPLSDDEWTKGKCGFKALQYMALEIPAVASPVGANTEIIDHGVNGFLSSSQDEWIRYLSQLINNKTLRKQMGKKGRQKVIDQFSVASNKDNFLSLFS